MDAGLELIEITFTVPGAPDLVRRLLDAREGGGPPWIGMGTVTTPDRARAALDAGTEFVVTPNVEPEVAALVREAGVYLVVGALTCSEIVAARRMGADLIKVYPLPPVGGPGYLEVIRGPLGDIPMLAAGGYGVDEIPAYRAVGACAFGIGGPLLREDDEATRRHVERALRLARGEETA
jgi:2-dehydro-3-deoxyphosphogluconate aldolase/(4S)-4-hydroxy-2-oxoglutarate aldolase